MKPKVSTGYLTPQTNRKKTIPKLKRSDSESNEFLNFNFGEVSEDVLKKLMRCPIKKQLIIDLITSEKDKIEEYKKELEKQNDLSMSRSLQKVLKKPAESPTALLRRRLGQHQNASTNKDSDSSSSSRPESRQSMASTVPSPISFEKILEGVIAFVEVKSGERDRSDAVKAILTSMGATVRDKFTKDITHVIFKDGSFTTYQKANLVRSKLVSVLWLEACKSSGIRVPEKNYPAISAVGVNPSYEHNQTILCSQMQKDYEEIIREEFNKSIAIGEPLPSVKSVIDKRRTIMTPNISMANDFSKASQLDLHDQEVANIMRRTIHGPFNNFTPESPFDKQSDTRPVIDGDTDKQSDTGPIIDGDTDEDIFKEYSIHELQQKTSTVPEDMDLTDGIFEKSKENTPPRKSINFYNKKTPKINKTATNAVNHSESPTLLDNIYKRKTELFERSPELSMALNTELTPRTLRIFRKNATLVTPNKTTDDSPKRKDDVLSTKTVETEKRTYFNTVDELISVLQPSDKSEDKTTSTAMSSLRVSNNADKTNSNLISSKNNSFISNKNSFSPLDPNIIHNIIEQLDNVSVENERDKVTVRKKQIKSNLQNKKVGRKEKLSSSIESPILDTPPTHSTKLLMDNVTVRKKYTDNTKSNADPPEKIEMFAKKAIRFSSSSDDDNEKKDENSNPKLTVNLRSRRKTVCCIGCVNPDLQKVTKTNAKIEQPRNRRKTIHTNKTVENQSTNSEEVQNKEKRQTQNRRKTINSLNHVIPEQNVKDKTPKKKLRLSDPEEGIGIIKQKVVKKVSTTNESSDTESVRDSPQKSKSNNTNSRNRRYTIAGSSQNKINSKHSRTRRSASVADVDSDQSPNSGSDEKKMRRLRKLYDPDCLLIPSNRDDQEREDKRKAIKPNDLGVFVKPILSHKGKDCAENNESIVEEILNPITSKKQVKTKPNVRKYKSVNSDDDEQVELKKWISNRKKDENKKDNANTSRRSQRNLKNNNDDVDSESATPVMSRNQKTKPSQVFKQPNVPRTPRNTRPPTRQTPITPLRNRRSTLDFMSATLPSSRRKLKIDRVITPSIVCTKLHTEDVQVFKQIVDKLGRFNVEDEVSSKTTHLVAGEPKRTINMLRAISMGCWILKKEWLFSSLELGKWLPEEDFEETRFSPAVQKSRLQRQAFGPSYTMDMFQDCGLIYISRGSIPRCSDLQELVVLCKGSVTRIARSAKIVIGEYVKYEGIICVTETWLLDSITLNRRLPFTKYIIKPPDRRSVIV